MKVSGDELKFTGQEISMQLDNDAIDLSGLYGSLSSKLNQVAFTMPKIELKQLSSFVLNFEPQIPSNKLQNAIKIIRPTGSLSETFLYLDLEKLGSDYQVVSVLDNANFGAYLGSPEMRNLSGIISLSPGRGYLDIDSENIGLYFKSHFLLILMRFVYEASLNINIRPQFFYKKSLATWASGYHSLGTYNAP